VARMSAGKFTAPTSWMRTVDLHWLAGLVEGEATIGRRHLAITQVDPEPLIRVRAVCGGHVDNYGNGKYGKPFTRWHLYGADARTLARMLAPLLSKRRQRQLEPLLTSEARYSEPLPHLSAQVREGVIQEDHGDER